MNDNMAIKKTKNKAKPIHPKILNSKENEEKNLYIDLVNEQTESVANVERE